LVFPYDFLFKLVAGIITLFVILDPIGALPFFQAFTVSLTTEQRRKLAVRSVLIAMGLLLVFAYLGTLILSLLGIVISDFEIAGGLLLLIFALRDALSSQPLGASDTTEASKTTVSKSFETLAVIPIATPLLAGPGSLTTVMLLTRASSYGVIVATVAILVDCGLALTAFRASDRLNKWVGPSGLLIIGKVMDILMAAIAVSYLFAGIQGSAHALGL
jgi:multiple antibiotic resistance protein